MKWIVFAAIAAFVLFIGFGFDNKRWHINKKQFIALIAVLLVLPSMFATVPTGHTGIETLFGEVQDGTLEAGLHFINPLKNVIVMDNRAQKAKLSMQCFSSDIQEVAIEYTINYQIQKENAQMIYKTIGTDYYATVMEPRILDVVKSIIAKYSAESLIASREELSVMITEKLVDELSVYNIIVINTAIEDMDFSDAYTQAVEEKQVAEQEKLKAQIQQAQMLLEAEAQASKLKIEAEADAEVAKIKADAEAYAGEKEAEKNKNLSESLTSELIEYKYIEAWDGKLPEIVSSDTVIPILKSNGNTGTSE